MPCLLCFPGFLVADRDVSALSISEPRSTSAYASHFVFSLFPLQEFHIWNTSLHNCFFPFPRSARQFFMTCHLCKVSWSALLNAASSVFSPCSKSRNVLPWLITPTSSIGRSIGFHSWLLLCSLQVGLMVQRQQNALTIRYNSSENWLLILTAIFEYILGSRGWAGVFEFTHST